MSSLKHHFCTLGRNYKQSRYGWCGDKSRFDMQVRQPISKYDIKKKKFSGLKITSKENKSFPIVSSLCNISIHKLHGQTIWKPWLKTSLLWASYVAYHPTAGLPSVILVDFSRVLHIYRKEIIWSLSLRNARGGIVTGYIAHAFLPIID